MRFKGEKNGPLSSGKIAFPKNKEAMKKHSQLNYFFMALMICQAEAFYESITRRKLPDNPV